MTHASLKLFPIPFSFRFFFFFFLFFFFLPKIQFLRKWQSEFSSLPILDPFKHSSSLSFVIGTAVSCQRRDFSDPLAPFPWRVCQKLTSNFFFFFFEIKSLETRHRDDDLVLEHLFWQETFYFNPIPVSKFVVFFFFTDSFKILPLKKKKFKYN